MQVAEFEGDVVGCGIGEMRGTTLLSKTTTAVGGRISYTDVAAADHDSGEMWTLQQRTTYGSRDFTRDYKYPPGTRIRTPQATSK